MCRLTGSSVHGGSCSGRSVSVQADGFVSPWRLSLVLPRWTPGTLSLEKRGDLGSIPCYYPEFYWMRSALISSIIFGPTKPVYFNQLPQKPSQQFSEVMEALGPRSRVVFQQAGALVQNGGYMILNYPLWALYSPHGPLNWSHHSQTMLAMTWVSYGPLRVDRSL